MLTRWTIMGAFMPWFRNHYDNYSKSYQEPYMYEEPAPSISRKYIEIRYKLIQYIYDAMYENTQNGKPICRPMFMNEVNPGKTIVVPEQIFPPHLLNNAILSSIKIR